MKELDLLKKDWNKKDTEFPKLSYNDIYKIIHKKSSSIVKWIFIICIAELFFWSFLNFLIPDSYLDIYEKFHLKTFLFVTQAIHYIILFVFIYLFYRNFKAICVKDTTNKLMKSIIKTRKTVNYYVYYNIILYAIISIVFNISMFSQPDILVEVMNPSGADVDSQLFINIMLIVQIVTFFIICGLLWLYYRIIYGILLKKLTRNYKELESLEF
ncbi:hypothetical protein ACFQ5N_07130 [Lutibacter holmesii]|uniref:Uncharacterized protein n=1 Tax=Lutibacter holmesii TaxID=1137985 RepID=A0ABW3WMX5_9FLAO